LKRKLQETKPAIESKLRSKGGNKKKKMADDASEGGASVLKYEFIQEKNKKVLVAKRCSSRL